MYANSAVSAKQLLNSNLISFNEPSLNIAIATSNHNDQFHVDGIVHAKAFVGDDPTLQILITFDGSSSISEFIINC